MSTARNFKAFNNRRGPSISTTSALRRNAIRNDLAVLPSAATKDVDESESEGSSLLVRNLPEDVTLKDVDELFSITIGPLNSCRLVHDSKGSFEGIALVEFVSPLHASKAWEVYNGKKIDGKIPLELLLVYPTPTSSSSLSPSVRAVVPRPTATATSKLKPTPTGPAALSSRVPPTKPRNGKPRPGPGPLTARLGPPVISLESRLGPLPSAAPSPSVSLSSFGSKPLPAGPKVGPGPGPGGKKKSGPVRKPIIKKKNGPKKGQNGMDGVQKI